MCGPHNSQELRAGIERLQNGVEKIAQASAQVADLQAALKQEQVRRWGGAQHGNARHSASCCGDARSWAGQPRPSQENLNICGPHPPPHPPRPTSHAPLTPLHLPRTRQIIVEEKKAATDELIVSIGREKAVVDEAVEASRGDEEAAASLQVRGWRAGGRCCRAGDRWCFPEVLLVPPACVTPAAGRGAPMPCQPHPHVLLHLAYAPPPAIRLPPQSEVQNFQEECTRDLAAAEPVIAEAEAALNRCRAPALGLRE